MNESLCGTLTKDITGKPFYPIKNAIFQLITPVVYLQWAVIF